MFKIMEKSWLKLGDVEVMVKGNALSKGDKIHLVTHPNYTY